jgi:hypothetical protein
LGWDGRDEGRDLLYRRAQRELGESGLECFRSPAKPQRVLPMCAGRFHSSFGEQFVLLYVRSLRSRVRDKIALVTLPWP